MSKDVTGPDGSELSAVLDGARKKDETPHREAKIHARKTRKDSGWRMYPPAFLAKRSGTRIGDSGTHHPDGLQRLRNN